jgi:Fe-S-cluster containining protein
MTAMPESPQTGLWYAGGLAFECSRCGRCCAGPEEGFVWISEPEIEALTKHLKMPIEHFRRVYLRREGRRYTIVENARTKDCIFLRRDPSTSSGPSPSTGSGPRCSIYDLRPSQCRTWPFWPSNLRDPDCWSTAAQRCRGINRGPLHTLDEICAKRDRTGT